MDLKTSMETDILTATDILLHRYAERSIKIKFSIQEDTIFLVWQIQINKNLIFFTSI